MKNIIPSICIGVAAILWSSAFAENPENLRFIGEGSGESAVFSMDGPWTLDWSVNSEFPLLASFEIRLHDGVSGKIIGRVAELEGIARGLKLFEQSGTFQIVVAGRSVNWEIDVLEVSEQQAADLKGGSSLSASSLRLSRRVPEGSFVEWRPEGDGTLLLFDDNEVVWRISFSPDCPGLRSASVISFVTPAGDLGGTDQFDSILLEDGTRCYFNSVIPGSVP